MPPHQSFKTLKLDRVARDFGAMNALKDLTVSVERGEFVALLGPSGCGKSTALNCIAGLLPTTRGSIWLDDKRIDTLGPEERGFGMVFQNYALFPHVNVRDNVGFGLKMRGITGEAAAKRIDAALATVRLANQAHKLPGQLSGGQQQRVAIARAIVIEPPLVLMDEPLSNLDAKLRLEMRQEIRRIHAGLGSITIYVTHDQDEALSLADRIIVLRDGEIRQIGAPEELYKRPVKLDVAEFMGFRNRIVGKVIAHSGNQVTLDIGGAFLSGVAGEEIVGAMGVAAIRPENLVASGLGLAATVDICEYRGHGFFGSAKGPNGSELYFSSVARVMPREEIHLAAAPENVLIFNGAAP
ncbi:ABC transporter ATP-binding protein [Methylovirgula sp. 4M-Z18]|uniref:ABC transporter ATP-binding protein n=1 Tax=Methylovirgula sp. 4M-Z18 TaxID=2293567 RepID=UPI000E2F7AFE|nr:ABC transporter ATP-binding protein [Methylovirgula sp. 4M-Z18]RFB80286.1 ABC transporter ATP-binding protein [Methylovirgula sp. 4M-Z18]